MKKRERLEDLRGKDSHELKIDVQALRKEAFELTFRSTGEDVANPSRRRQIRRTIARIHTLLRERETAKQKPQPAKQAPAK